MPSLFAVPLVDTATDTGPLVKGILQNPEEWSDEEIPVVGDPLTIPQVAEIYSKVYNVPTKVTFLETSPLVEKVPGIRDIMEGVKFPGYYPAYFGREHELTVKARKLNPNLTTFEQWLRRVGLEPIKPEENKD